MLQNFASTYYACVTKKERVVQLKAMEIQMEKAGFNRDATEIESRLNNMRQQFKVTSKERDRAIKWKFYEAMEKIMKVADDPMDISIISNK